MPHPRSTPEADMSETLDRRKPALIVAAGFIGGLGAWVWAVTVGPSPLLPDPVLAIPSYMFLGAIAGFLGVYLIAKTDPAETTHAIAFSLACGVFWGPVISGAEAIVNRSKVEQASREVAAQQAAVVRAQAEVADTAQRVQADLAGVAQKAQELDRARREIMALSQSGVAVSPEIRNRLERIDTVEIRRELEASSARLELLGQELQEIHLQARLPTDPPTG
jgi:hypothetical protein